MRRIRPYLLLFAFTSSLACATGQVLTKTAPTLTEQQQVRVSADRAADDLSGGLDVAQELSVRLDQLSLSTAIKDDVDCALLKVLGTPKPAPAATVKTCGAIPLRDKAPFHVAIETLKNITSCASLRTTVAEALKWVDPLIDKLVTSKQAALALAATALQTTLRFSRALIGGQGCSA